MQVSGSLIRPRAHQERSHSHWRLQRNSGYANPYAIQSRTESGLGRRIVLGAALHVAPICRRSTDCDLKAPAYETRQRRPGRQRTYGATDQFSP